MERIIDVAQFIFDEYQKISGNVIDEMKLHKLLYFAQRENLALMNQPLFEEDFEGWKYGPVSPVVRSKYTEDGMVCKTKPISQESAYIVKNILSQYGYIESWKLSELTHQESSWKNSRKNLLPYENGDNLISMEDIREDAKKVRPYDSTWDMYFDEFEDAEDLDI